MADEFYLRSLVYPIPEHRPARVQSDLVYKRANSTVLKMDVYTPADLAEEVQLPAVLFVHGGPVRPDLSFTPKDWGVYQSYGRLMAAFNLAGITFNHRLFAAGDLPKSADDVMDALRYVRDNSRKLNVDPNRLCLWGFSGGGPLLGFALRGALPFLRCWLAFYARLDLRNGSPQTLAALSAEDVRRFSAILALEEGGLVNLPMFVARAGQDRPVLNETIDAFVQKALAMNKPLTLVNHASGRHAFDVVDDDVRTREIIEMAIAFIRVHVSS